MSRNAPEPIGPVVRVHEVAGELGAAEEVVRNRAEFYGVPIVTDWAGRPGFRVEHAAELYGRVRADWDSHDAKQDAYRRYVEERKQAAADQRARAIAEARQRSQEENRRRLIRHSEETARRNEEEAARKAAERAAAVGKPMGFEEFAKKAG